MPGGRRPQATPRRIDPTVEFLEAEVRRLRDVVATLQAESAAHIRRFGELQLELDRLKNKSNSLSVDLRPMSREHAGK